MLRSFLRRFFSKLLTTEARLRDENVNAKASFYVSSDTCQIPNLCMIYEQYFGQRKNGCFVEIGAYDGEYVSNTSGIADAGWTGYYVEPVQEYYRKCVERHKCNRNVKVDQLAIGAGSGTVAIAVGGPLSTVRDGMKHIFESLEWAQGYFSGESYQVKLVPLEQYLTERGVPRFFDLLVVDVEGYEWEVFRRFDIAKWQPKMVIVELHDQNDDYFEIRESCNKTVEYFDKNNYKIIYKDNTNTIFVPKDSFPVFRTSRLPDHNTQKCDLHSSPEQGK